MLLLRLMAVAALLLGASVDAAGVRGILRQSLPPAGGDYFEDPNKLCQTAADLLEQIKQEKQYDEIKALLKAVLQLPGISFTQLSPDEEWGGKPNLLDLLEQLVLFAERNINVGSLVFYGPQETFRDLKTFTIVKFQYIRGLTIDAEDAMDRAEGISGTPCGFLHSAKQAS
eukprot:CAMPEP_0203744374 /NCGR_PEP_ID=MMETSP0098-20131031/468_1 /ASSEMBLY_ACC=CAM_ASM_000208 /TAXON_ID=96639 /ORGANISM=" , Strain NY0313808BC1" /LENGTH=170 /DNA_ID=CAMNT_0050631879 /DNA_START=223 /DNA_END=735 /DNA_ORIENTATION=+